MANSFTRLAGHCLNTAESTLIQGNVNDNCLDPDTYRDLFSEGSVYSLSTCLSDAPVSIQFNDGTLFVDIKNLVKQIPIEFFRFCNHDQLLSLANTNKQLSDILREVIAIKSTIKTQGTQPLILTLRLERDVNVCVSLFDGLAFAFHTKLESYGSEPKVVMSPTLLHSSIRRIYSVLSPIYHSKNTFHHACRLFVNGTSQTHLYCDSETTVGQELYEKRCDSRSRRDYECQVTHQPALSVVPASVCPAATNPILYQKRSGKKKARMA
ncbi:unnamed protein product [Brassica oleracea]